MVDSRRVGAMVAVVVAVAFLMVAAGCGAGPSQDGGVDTTTTPTADSTDGGGGDSDGESGGDGGGESDDADDGGVDSGSASPVTLFAPASNCAPCHSDVPSEGDTVSFNGDWSQSMMAAAAEDPYFQAKLLTETEAYPEHEALIESKCLACHMPMATRQASLTGGALDFQTVQAGESPHQSLAMDGVSCTVCHQIQPEGLGTPETFSGEFAVDTTTRQPNRSIFGPFDPVNGDSMKFGSGFEPVQADHMESAALCGSCHTLYTPTLNESGAIVGTFPEQTPYLEWQESMYAETTPCQSCHMPGAEGVALASSPSGLPKRSVNKHQFAGANAQMATLLGNDEGAENARAQLRDYIGVSIQEVERVDGNLHVTVAVRNGAGHKFPAGFPSRRAWLHLRVQSSGGETVFESGAVAEDGSITGRDTPYEPHYDTIEDAAQVQIYQSVMTDVDGQVTRTLLEADGYVKDNRIPPVGFEPGSVDADIAVAGDATADSTFTGGRDTVTYVIEDAPETGTVDANLYYQPVSRPFLDAETGSEDPTVTQFLEDYEQVNKTTVVGSDSASIGA